MIWSKKMPEPIKLRDGRELRTLYDAGVYIQGLPESAQGKPFWRYATELLLAAAETGKADDVKHAWAQVYRALTSDGVRKRA